MLSESPENGGGVMVLGAGALGAPACAHLAVAGVDRLAVVDDAEVGPSGGSPLSPRGDGVARRAEEVAAWLAVLARDVHVDPYPARLDETNAEAMIAGHDVVLDLTNDRPTRAVVSEACSAARIPLVAGWLSGTVGWLAAVHPPESPCLGCAQRGVPEGPVGDKREASARSPLAGALGALAALAALQLLGETGNAWIGRRLLLDGRDLAARVELVSSVPSCTSCEGAHAGAYRR
jgi:adenylyltransferase/sulfurtransferase